MPSFSQILAQSVTDAGVKATVVYATAVDLPLVGNTAGDIALVSETNRLYIFTGAGWYNVALINTNPTIITAPDGSYKFATDGTPIVITLQAQDPEEVPIAWSYTITSGALGSTATVQQEGNVFTITPSTDENDAGQFSITFTASDGVNLATAVSSFTLSFNAWADFSAVTSITSGALTKIADHDSGTAVNCRGYTYSPDGMYQYYWIYNTRELRVRINTTPWSINVRTDGWSTVGAFLDSNGAPFSGIGSGLISDDGTKALVIVGSTSTHTFHKYQTSTPWDFSSTSSRTSIQESSSITTNRGTSYAWMPQVSEDGLYVSFVSNDNNGEVFVWKMTSPWDLSTLTHYGTIAVAGAGNSVYHCGGILPNGTAVWNFGYTTDTFYFKRLSTPFDLNSAGSLLTVTTVSAESSVHANISADGSRIYGMRQGTPAPMYQRSVTFNGIM